MIAWLILAAFTGLALLLSLWCLVRAGARPPPESEAIARAVVREPEPLELPPNVIRIGRKR